MTDNADNSSDPWREFRDRLSTSLGLLDPDEFIFIGTTLPDLERTAPFAQIVCLEDAFLVEVTSNEFLSEVYRLLPPEKEALVNAGWKAPDAPRTNWMLFVEEPEEAAAAVVFGLRDVFRIREAAMLSYDAPGQAPLALTPEEIEELDAAVRATEKLMAILAEDQDSDQ